jgi:transposase
MSVPKQESTTAESRRRGRRSWSEEEKRRILAETLEPGASVSVVARRHDMNANLLFTWRRMLGAMSSLPGVDTVKLVPAVVTSEPAATVPTAWSSRIEIALAGGDRVIVDSTVDAVALARVIKVLSRR